MDEVPFIPAHNLRPLTDFSAKERAAVDLDTLLPLRRERQMNHPAGCARCQSLSLSALLVNDVRDLRASGVRNSLGVAEGGRRCQAGGGMVLRA